MSGWIDGTHQHVQDLGLGTGMVEKLQAAVPLSDCESCRRTMLGKTAAPISMYVGWVGSGPDWASF